MSAPLSDDQRDRLAKALQGLEFENPLADADALAPVVAAMLAEARAEALRQAADRWEQAVVHNRNALDMEVADRVVGWLRDRAALADPEADQ